VSIDVDADEPDASGWQFIPDEWTQKQRPGSHTVNSVACDLGSGLPAIQTNHNSFTVDYSKKNIYLGGTPLSVAHWRSRRGRKPIKFPSIRQRHQSFSLLLPRLRKALLSTYRPTHYINQRFKPLCEWPSTVCFGPRSRNLVKEMRFQYQRRLPTDQRSLQLPTTKSL
jgi:hypothetical protein